MMDIITSRLNRIGQSQTVSISAKARELKVAGRDIISLSAGEPDFNTPDFICQAATKAMHSGETKYTDVSGTFILRKAICDRFRLDSSIDYKPNEIIVSSGAKQVIFNAIMCTVEAGDEVIIPSPCWVSYPDIVSLAEGKPIIVPAIAEDGYRLDLEAIEKAITSRTKWLILNYPNNPTGASISTTELRAVADILLRHPHVWVLSDEIYNRLVYDDFTSINLIEIEPSLRSRAVIINGVSKTYAMTGWRLGYAAAPEILIKSMIKLQSQSTTNASSISQAAAVAALTGDQSFLGEWIRIYQNRRDLVVSMINQTNGLKCHIPHGAFYVFPSLKNCLGRKTNGGYLIDSDKDFVTALLEEEGVATVHGSAFLFDDHFRISYATDIDSLREACTRVQRFCASLITQES